MIRVTLYKIGKKKYQLRWKEGEKRPARTIEAASKRVAEQERIRFQNRLNGARIIPEGPPNYETIISIMEVIIFPLKSDNYERNIRRDLSILKKYCNDDFSMLTPQIINLIMGKMAAKKKKSTVKTWRANCSAALTIAAQYGVISENPIKKTPPIKLGKHKPAIITPDQEELLFEAAGTGRKNIRDTLIVAMGLYGGMRVHEIAGFDIRTDIGVQDKIIARPTKTHQDRTVALPTKYYNMLKKYATVRRQRSSSKPFYKGISSSVTARFDQIREKAGMKRNECSLTILRHTCATRLAQAGWVAWDLMIYMGHEDIKTTMKYYIGISTYGHENVWDNMPTHSPYKPDMPTPLSGLKRGNYNMMSNNRKMKAPIK